MRKERAELLEYGAMRAAKVASDEQAVRRWFRLNPEGGPGLCQRATAAAQATVRRVMKQLKDERKAAR